MATRSKSKVRETITSRRPVAIDLFAGAGGLSLGFEQAGFDVVSAVEYDPVHAAVHEYNFPHTEVLCRDVSRLSASELLAAARRGLAKHYPDGRSVELEIDVMFGGPPCQGFSTIGKRLVDDDRNKLVFHFFRLVTELKPRYFVMENVPGMKAGGHSSILDQLIAEFSATYDLTLPVQVLRAAEFGVPQDRRRLFLIGARKGLPKVEYPTPRVRPAEKRASRAQKGLAGLSLEAGPTVQDALSDIPDLDMFDELLTDDSVEIGSAIFEKYARKASSYALRLRGDIPDPADLSYIRAWDPTLLTSSMRTEHTKLSVSRFEATIPGETEPVSRFYRLPPHGLCNTLRAGTGSERGAYTSPRPIHPSLPRVISVREAARLHSFPDWFRLHKTKWHGFRQVGNAVPPLLGRAVAQKIVEALGVAPPKPSEIISLGVDQLLSMTMSEAASHFGAETDQIPGTRKRLTVTA